MKLDETTHNKILVQILTFQEETKKLQAELTDFTRAKENEFSEKQKVHATLLDSYLKEYCEKNNLDPAKVKINPLTGEVENADNTGV